MMQGYSPARLAYAKEKLRCEASSARQIVHVLSGREQNCSVADRHDAIPDLRTNRTERDDGTRGRRQNTCRFKVW